MESKTGTLDAWSRPAVTYRLTEKRKRDLLMLAKTAETSLSPTAAVDHAIESALAAKSIQEPTDSLDSSESAEHLGRLIASFGQFAVEQRAARTEMSRALEELRGAIMEAGHATGERDPGEDVVSLNEWLRVEAQSLPQPSMVAMARWQAKNRLDRGRFSIDIWVERVAAAGLAGEAGRGRPALARLGPLEPGSVAGQLDAMPSAFLLCQRDGSGWTVSLHPTLEDGAPGESIGVARV